MMTHSIVYIVLSLLSLVAVHAMSAPVNETRQDQHEAKHDAEEADRQSTDTL
jgi:Na+-transporting methylmalonyl-CoA/oxaloacetate decarboxylase gamma subunit